MGRIHWLDVELEGSPRRAALYLPSTYDGSTPTPLVLGTHGRGGSGEVLYERYGWQRECEARGWIGLFPNSTRPKPDSPDDNDFFVYLLDRLSSELAVDPKRIYGTGFSGGCHRQYALLVQHSDRLAGIAVAGGVISHGNRPEHEDPLHTGASPPSILHMHGLADTSVPFAGGAFTSPRGEPRNVVAIERALEPWIQAMGAAEVEQPALPEGAPATRDLTTRRWEAPDGRVVQLLVDPKLPHAWPKEYGTQVAAAFLAGCSR